MPLFAPKELNQIAAKASTIDERISGGFSFEEESLETATSRLSRWSNLAAKGDEELFKRRLALDGLDVSDALLVLREIKGLVDPYEPKWLTTFQWVSEWAITPCLPHEEQRLLDSETPFPFEEIFVSSVLAARDRVIELVGPHLASFTDTALRSLSRDLLEKLTALCGPALLERFRIFKTLRYPGLPSPKAEKGVKTSRIVYLDFIKYLRAGGLRAVFQDYPVLARLLATIVDNWIDSVAEFNLRLTDDLSSIEESFSSQRPLGLVTDLDCSISDPHESARSVHVVYFENGLKVVYKPKNLGVQVAWQSLLTWLNRKGAPLHLKTQTILSRLDYGWAEYVEQLECSSLAEIQRYYFRAGMLSCLVYLLHATDSHIGNVVASADQPVLIDLETVLQPILNEGASSGNDPAAVETVVRKLRKSVLASSILPCWAAGIDGHVISVGGIGSANQGASVCTKYRQINTDAMHQEEMLVQLSESKHLPRLRGEVIGFENFGDLLVTGFEAMYKFLLTVHHELISSPGPLEQFKLVKVRFVFRSTKLYGLLLQRSLELKNIRDGAEWSLQFEFLSRYFDLTTHDVMWQIFRAERLQLSNLDIPFFMTSIDGNTISLPSGIKIDGCFEGSSYQQLLIRIGEMNEKDMSCQSEIVRFATHSGPVKIRQRTFSKGKFLGKGELDASCATNLASEIAILLQREASWARDGASWIGAVPLPGHEKVNLGEIGYSLYSGTTGIALFLSALEHVSPNDHCRRLAYAALAPVRSALRNPKQASPLKINLGAGDGLGSIVYGLTHSARLLGDDSILSDAHYAANLITERPQIDHNLGIMSGIAGAILALLVLFRASRKRMTLEKAIEFGRILLTAEQFIDNNRNTMSGFLQGAPGISYSLLSLYDHCHKVEFLDGAIALRDEIVASLLPRKHNIQGQADAESRFPVSTCSLWCGGIPGVGLGLAKGLQIHDSDDVRALVLSLRILEVTPPSQIDSLCCGEFGRIESLFELGHLLDRPELKGAALNCAQERVNFAISTGTFSWPQGTDKYNLGLFSGIAGIGYELLRLTHPQKLPSVLLWE